MAVRCFIAILLFVASALIAAQQPAVFRAEANYVEITAIPTDRSGNFVSGLSAADFEVTEQLRPQTVSMFSYVDIPTSGGAAAAPAARFRPDVLADSHAIARLYLLVVDSPVDTGDAQHCRAPDLARQFIQDFLLPGDLAAVWSGNANEVAFSQDRDALLHALGPMLSVGGSGLVYGTERALRDPVRLLTGIQGRRKSLVFFSCGWIPNRMMLRPGKRMGDQVRQMHDGSFADLTGDADLHIYPVDARGLIPMAAMADVGGDSPPRKTGDLRSSSVLMGLTSATSTKQFRPGHAVINDIMLKTLATDSGGIALLGRNNDYRTGFREIVQDNSRYYILGYSSPVTWPTGEFVDVNVKVRRPAVSVRARKGYLAN